MKIRQSFQSLVLVLLFTVPASVLLAQEVPITTSSKEAKKLFIQGRDKLENAETILAADLFDKAIALDPNFALAYAYRAQSGGTASALRAFREKAMSLADKASEGEKYLIESVVATADGKIELRRELNDKLVKMFPKDKRVHVMSGLFFTTIQQYPEAITCYTKALEIDKNFGPACNLLGYTHMNMKNWDESEKAFKRYIELMPGSPNPYDSYAEMLLKSGRYDDAITNFKKAMEVSPAFINSLTPMGVAYIHKGDFQGARECYKQQLAKAPSYNWKLNALLNTMQSYLHEGLPSEAIKAYSEVQALIESEKQVPGMIGSYAGIGWIYLENDDLSEAGRYFQMARRMTEKGDLTEAQREGNRLGRLVERFMILIRVDEFESAEKVLAETKKMIDNRKNPLELGNYYTNVGIMERYKGNYDAALEAFSKSNKDDPYAMYQKAMTLELKGDREGAMKLYKEVVNWNWNNFAYALVRNKAKQKLTMAIGAR